jgi:L-fuculokinase
MSDLLGIIDIGKTHARLFIAEPGGAVISRSRREHDVCDDSAVVRQLDIRGIEEWLIDTLRSHPYRERIRTLVPIAHGAAAVLIDDDENVLLAPDYEDSRFDSVAEVYRPLRDPFELSYSPFLPLGLNLGRQLFYLESRAPELMSRTRQLLLYPQFWAWRLSGVAASELTSLGCHSDLWRPLTGHPTDLAVSRGWTALLPPLRAAGDVLGPVSAQLAQLTGLSSDCQVLTGLHDSNACFLAHLAACRQDAFAVVSSGTWTVVMARGASLRHVREHLDMLVNVDATGSPVVTARFMGGREYEVIAGPSGLQVQPSHDDLAAIIAARALALPSFSRAGGPFASVTGRLIVAERLGPPQLAALATLYVALMSDYVLDLIEFDGDVFVDGPLAQNGLYLDLLAALRPGRKILASRGSAAAAAAAQLCGIACSGLEYSAAAAGLDPARLADYRSMWRDAVAEHCRTGTSPGGPPW